MISIEDAIEKSKEIANKSDGGTTCYDFGDVVLIKYAISLEYCRNGNRARENEEIVMKGVNEIISKGVNTPRHLDMKRTIEDGKDVCYVLQEKVKGKNCANMGKYGEPIDVVLEELKYVNAIPFKHIEKLVSDSCMIYNMGYEPKNHNLFYDEETGFWFIDFLENKEEKFDVNKPETIFETVKYICPKPINLAGLISFDAEITKEENEKYNELRNALKAKYLLACENMIPEFKKYEFFYLLNEENEYKKYLMSEGLVDRDLFSATSQDFEIYDELYSLVVNEICKEISNGKAEYWHVEDNEIRYKSELFDLETFYKKFICKDIKQEEFDDEWDYEIKVKESYTNNMMESIYKRISSIEPNENISKFISEYESKRKNNFTP